MEEKKSFMKKAREIFYGLTKKQRLGIGVGSVVLVILIGWGIAYNSYGIGMSDKAKSTKINSKIKEKKYDEARKLANKYYSENDEKEKAVKDLLTLSIDSCEKYNVGSFEEVLKGGIELAEDYAQTKALKIEKVEIVYEKTSKYVKTTVFNSGNTAINYVKLNLYFKDANGNVIDSDWTNESSVILPGAKKVIMKRIDKNLSFDTVTSEIDSFRLK